MILVGIAAEVAAMCGISGGGASRLHNLYSVLMFSSGSVSIRIGAAANGAGMGGVSSGGTGGSSYFVLILVGHTINIFNIGAAAGAGIGLDSHGGTGRLSCDFESIAVGMAVDQLVQFLGFYFTADSARAFGHALGRCRRLLGNDPIAPGMSGSGLVIILVGIAADAGIGGIAPGGASRLCNLLGIGMGVIQSDILHIDPAICSTAPDIAINGCLLKDFHDDATFQSGYEFVVCARFFPDVKRICIDYSAGNAYRVRL